MYNNIIKQMQEEQKQMQESNSEDKRINGILYCGKCHTPKEAYIESVGGLCPIPCKCATEKIKEREIIEAERMRKRKVRELQIEAFNDSTSLDNTFSADDNQDPSTIEFAKTYVRNWPSMRANGTGLLLFGAVGTGKTFIACCIANALIEQCVSVYFFTVRELLNNYSSFKKREDLIEKIKKCGLLIIDDLGTELNNDKNNDVLFDIIDTRYRSGKPLIVTTNLETKEFKYPERERERIYSRITQKCVPVTINKVQRRKQLAKQNAETARQILGL